MLVFSLIFFLSLWQELVGIECIHSDDQLVDYPLENFVYEDFERRISELPSYDYQNDNINMCRIEIYIDYQNQLMTISFADSFQWSELDDGEGRLDFLIILDPNDIQPQFYNVLEYTCYDDNQCEKVFLFQHISWLLNVNYSILESQLKRLLLQTPMKIEQCFIDKNTLINCSNGICLGKYSSYYHNYLFECHENSDASVEVHITTTMSMEAILNKYQMIRYTCQFNRCNNQSFTDLLWDTINKYYPLSEMEEAFLSTGSHHFTRTSMTTDLLSSTTTAMENQGLSLNSMNKYQYFILLMMKIYMIDRLFE